MAIGFGSVQESIRTIIAQNMEGNYVSAIIVFLVSYFILWVFKKYILGRIKKIAKKTKTQFDDVSVEFIEEIHWPFYAFISLYISTHFLILPGILKVALNYILIIFLVFYATVALSKAIDFVARREIEKRKKEEGKLEQTSFIKVIGKIIKFFVWVVAILLIASNLGLNVSSLLAGLGIGGLAIAFALQKILEDIFSSFSIYFDKPFKEGDFILIGTDLGAVKHIGLKTTRIQTLQGQELVVSNKELTNTRINNFKKMERRRITFKFGVEYGTKLVKLKKIPGIVKNIMGKLKLADLDRVHFKEFGDFSLNFEVAYYINSKEYIDYMNTQQEFNFQLKQAFEKEKIEFAFPTQTIFVKK